MAVDERARHELHGRLDDVLGREEATTLMSLLPPVGWADVATKHDLDSLRIELRAEIGQLRGELRGEIGQLRGEFHRDLGVLTRTLMISMLTAVIAVAGLAFGAARLI
jgi:hypothetical protein